MIGIIFRVRSGDARLSYNLKRGENPHRVDRKLGLTALALIALAVLGFGSAAIFDVFRPDRTESDASFAFSEDCGGSIGDNVVTFDRTISIHALWDTVRDQLADGSYDAYVFVVARDDEGRLASRKWHFGAIDASTADECPIQVRLELDRPAIGEVRCVAWSSFDADDPNLSGPLSPSPERD